MQNGDVHSLVRNFEFRTIIPSSVLPVNQFYCTSPHSRITLDSELQPLTQHQTENYYEPKLEENDVHRYIELSQKSRQVINSPPDGSKIEINKKKYVYHMIFSNMRECP